MDNYTIYHLHSDFSNAVTNIDSVTKYEEYIEAAKNAGMTSLGFSEHGSVFGWYHKKTHIEEAGMKYIHGAEVYLTESLDEKVRDNYHCVLIAKNYSGFLELNRLISRSFNRYDNHFYYVPRIALQELYSASNDIVVTSACIGGIFGKASEESQNKMLKFMSDNSDRCFLEIGHHMDERQVEYNKRIVEFSRQYNIPLIAGTDTHVLNKEHEQGRLVLQASKNIHFGDEDKWDLKFHTYDTLVEAYRLQGCLQPDVYMEAIANTNALADSIEEFKIDTSVKYPRIYENSEEVFIKKIYDALDKHPYVKERHSAREIEAQIQEEIAAYKATKSIDFMLLQCYLREWEHENGIECGYGRGSVSGSLVAYILGITHIDSLKFDLNFFRFINPSRISNADIDTDYSSDDRDRVKKFLLQDKMGLPNINSSEIVTFNTIETKGAIRDVGRALEIPLDIVGKICKDADIDINTAIKNWSKDYPDLFTYVDIVKETIVSIGSHPSGVLVGDFDIESIVGLCSLSKSEYPVSMLNMKELDDLMVVKLDLLGLSNIGVVNLTCKYLGIERLTPDNVNLDDIDVWKSIRDDTTLIFQWESISAQQYLKKFMSDKTLAIAQEKIPNFSMIKWLSFGNGLIRPACASFRDSVASGEFYDNGLPALNEFLAQEAGHIAMQETIMRFLVEFCGYSPAESDNVRRSISKKKGTEELLPEIESRFISYTSECYGISIKKCEKVIKPFLQIILDASAYAFSWNHSDSYSILGYICGYLRYYYPVEFITAALNVFSDKMDKVSEIIRYAKVHKITILSPKWGISKSECFYDKDKNMIARGLSSVKFMSASVADELYDLSKRKKYIRFSELLYDIYKETSLNSRQLDVLVKIDFFSDFGNQRELLLIIDNFEFFGRGDAKQIRIGSLPNETIEKIVDKYSRSITKSGKPAKSYTITDIDSIISECETLILSQKIPDIPDEIKVKNFIDTMGYNNYVSGNEQDRKKLYIKDIHSLQRKKDGKQFGYGIITQSIGSGIESRFTVFNSLYDQSPIKKGDIIICDQFKRDGKYFTMLAYRHITRNN